MRWLATNWRLLSFNVFITMEAYLLAKYVWRLG